MRDFSRLSSFLHDCIEAKLPPVVDLCRGTETSCESGREKAPASGDNFGSGDTGPAQELICDSAQGFLAD